MTAFCAQVPSSPKVRVEHLLRHCLSWGENTRVKSACWRFFFLLAKTHNKTNLCFLHFYKVKKLCFLLKGEYLLNTLPGQVLELQLDLHFPASTTSPPAAREISGETCNLWVFSRNRTGFVHRVRAISPPLFRLVMDRPLQSTLRKTPEA